MSAMTALSVFALGAILVAGGLRVAPEVIIVDPPATAAATILGALMMVAALVLRPKPRTTPTSTSNLLVLWVASLFVMVVGIAVIGIAIIGTVHSDAAFVGLAVGALLVGIGFGLRPRS